mmetsp:Transcript_729/g.1765  ORF Transcript_729/g.1765 Transcript_729/m.1765 type:complete len:580 (-) Transcript_729:283-2022(-)
MEPRPVDDELQVPPGGGEEASNERSALLPGRAGDYAGDQNEPRGLPLLNLVLPGTSEAGVDSSHSHHRRSHSTAEEEEERRRKKEERHQQARLRRTSVFAADDNDMPSIKLLRHQHRAVSMRNITASSNLTSSSNSNSSNSHSERVNHNTDHQSHYKRDVEYDGENHLGVLFQLYGSVWPSVLPWCISTLLVTMAVWYLRENDIIDLSIASNTGHSFMSILVSFLIVTRTTITYNRFMEARQHLGDLYRSSREIVHYTCLLTNQNTNDDAKKWRQEVAYRTIVSLRVAVAALEYRSKGINTWEVIPDQEHEKTELMIEHDDASALNELSERPSTPGSGGDRPLPVRSLSSPTGSVNSSSRFLRRTTTNTAYKPSTDHFAILKHLAHGPRTRTDENFRAPIVWAYNLREVILWPRKKGSVILRERDWHVNESLKLLALVSDFVAAYHELKKLVSTPFPFPLIQMTRTFLFFWVFTLPMVLCEDNDQPYEVLVLMFFITYGFLGLEYVNIELDDPYGNDPNDFPGQRWAETVFEDCYIAIYKTDGYASAVELRGRISERTARGSPLENFRTEHQSVRTGAH